MPKMILLFYYFYYCYFFLLSYISVSTVVLRLQLHLLADLVAGVPNASFQLTGEPCCDLRACSFLKLITPSTRATIVDYDSDPETRPWEHKRNPNGMVI